VWLAKWQILFICCCLCDSLKMGGIIVLEPKQSCFVIFCSLFLKSVNLGDKSNFLVILICHDLNLYDKYES